MMDYCSKESTLQTCEEVRNESIKMHVQETYKILKEMNHMLQEFAAIVNGSKLADDSPKDAGCLLDESKYITQLAYENMKRLAEIKDSII